MFTFGHCPNQGGALLESFGPPFTKYYMRKTLFLTAEKEDKLPELGDRPLGFNSGQTQKI